MKYTEGHDIISIGGMESEEQKEQMKHILCVLAQYQKSDYGQYNSSIHSSVSVESVWTFGLILHVCAVLSTQMGIVW